MTDHDDLKLTQPEMDYGQGYACYKIDRKGATPMLNWPYIQGFCSALADDVGHDYTTIYDAFKDFFTTDAADTLLEITLAELDKTQEWFRWPSMPVK